MDVKKQQALLAASVAGLVTAFGMAGASWGAQAKMPDETAAKAPCYGINKCQAIGECGGKDHGCAGKNGCEGQGYVALEKETCLKIKGGRLTPEPEVS